MITNLLERLGETVRFEADNQRENMQRTLGIIEHLQPGTKISGILLLFAVFAFPVRPQTFTTLHSFEGPDGANPYASVVQGLDGNFYGTARAGGVNTYPCNILACGTIFRITPGGALTTIHSFCSESASCSDGMTPMAGLVLGTDGNFFGTTESGGPQGSSGTVFKITPAGTLTTLHGFCATDCTDGIYPVGGLVEGANGDFYGTTSSGLSSQGTVFRITKTGDLTTLYTFCSQGFPACPDGASPQSALVQAPNGDLYGTTVIGGDCLVDEGCGTVFRITPSGSLTTLYSFCSQRSVCSDGENPAGALVQASNGNFYGTTYEGGPEGGGGTVFEITPGGALTTLYSFCGSSGCAAGAGDPLAGLVQATNGYLYGTTEFSGPGGIGGGAIFKMTPGGALSFLYSIACGTSCTNGSGPLSLTQATNGMFYGTTEDGGSSDACENGCGTVFSFSVGLGPFVEAKPTSGKVGTKVEILGMGLTGATSVTFDGSPATFTVVSSSEVITTVPSGAANGKIEVITPTAMLTSNVVFRVSQ